MAKYVVQRPGDYAWAEWDDLAEFKTQAAAVSDAQRRTIRPIRVIKREVVETELARAEPLKHTEIKEAEEANPILRRAYR